ncbi:MAG TPA: hypothetical protein VIU13_04420, partial [Chryseolinea sp.]
LNVSLTNELLQKTDNELSHLQAFHGLSQPHEFRRCSVLRVWARGGNHQQPYALGNAGFA